MGGPVLSQARRLQQARQSHTASNTAAQIPVLRRIGRTECLAKKSELINLPRGLEPVAARGLVGGILSFKISEMHGYMARSARAIRTLLASTIQFMPVSASRAFRMSSNHALGLRSAPVAWFSLRTGDTAAPNLVTTLRDILTALSWRHRQPSRASCYARPGRSDASAITDVLQRSLLFSTNPG